MTDSELSLWTFELLGVLAIFAGGCLAAFTAKKPSRFISWASAYLVIVVGLFQAIIGVLLHRVANDPSTGLVLLAFLTYNLANAGVLIGTTLKSRHKNYRSLVDTGGVLFIISMGFLLLLAHHSEESWQLILLYIIVLTILITMPIGVTLSHRRKSKIITEKG